MPAPSSPSEDKIVILDFGSQYTQVIARRIRECRVYSEILPFWTDSATLRRIAPKGIILSGGPASVYALNAPRLDTGVYELGVPLLGICYGLQLIAWDLGARWSLRRIANTARASCASIVAPIFFTAFPQRSMSGTVTEIRLESFRRASGCLAEPRIPAMPPSATQNGAFTVFNFIRKSLTHRGER